MIKNVAGSVVLISSDTWILHSMAAVPPGAGSLLPGGGAWACHTWLVRIGGAGETAVLALIGQ